MQRYSGQKLEAGTAYRFVVTADTDNLTTNMISLGVNPNIKCFVGMAFLPYSDPYLQGNDFDYQSDLPFEGKGNGIFTAKDVVGFLCDTTSMEVRFTPPLDMQACCGAVWSYDPNYSRAVIYYELCN